MVYVTPQTQKSPKHKKRTIRREIAGDFLFFSTRQEYITILKSQHYESELNNTFIENN